MKFLFKLFLIVLVILIILGSISLFIGYSYYNEAIEEKSLSDRINEITSDDTYVKYEDISKIYLDAVLAIEDHRYYEHGPIDPIAIIRAIYTNLINFELLEGGSTITQQVGKNVVFSQERSMLRKLGELFAAFDLENNYSKDEILTFYVNTAYFGNGYYGIYEASYGYFNKDPKDLTLDEASMLAGIPNAPSIYAPTENPDLAEERQKQVLERMIECNYISESEADLI